MSIEITLLVLLAALLHAIVLGVIFGAKLLTEENFRSRIAGALLIMAGIVFLSQ